MSVAQLDRRAYWHEVAAAMQTWPRQRAPRVTVEPVRTAADLTAFVDLPWQIYRDDPHWVPPLKREVHAFLDRRRHPFYRHGEARLFLARLNGQVVGRILASDDPRHNEEHGTNLGCFGMFESIDDQEVADALLEAAADWLRLRGRTEVMGPIDYSTNYPCGLLVDGFDTPPRVMMNHHPPYYARLLEHAGLEKAKDLYAWWFNDPGDAINEWRGRVEKLAARFNVTVRSVRLSDYDREIERCKRVYNEAWEKSWGFVKMTDAEFDHLAAQIKQLRAPQMLKLAEVDGQPVGLSVTMPDLNEAIKPLDGRLTRWGLPIGLARLIYRLPRVKTARMAVLGVLEGYRRRGVGELLILSTLDDGKHLMGYHSAELGWTLEDNHLVNRTVERVGGRRYKTYRIYHRPLFRAL